MIEWETLKSDIYFIDGSVRDIVIHDFSEEYWHKWINFVNDNYSIEWWCVYDGKNNKKINKINFDKVKYFWDHPEEGYLPGPATVYFNDFSIAVHFFDAEFFECSFWPGEIKTESDHNCIIKFMSDISYLLDKEVYFYFEGAYININAYNLKLYKEVIEYQPVPTMFKHPIRLN